VDWYHALSRENAAAVLLSPPENRHPGHHALAPDRATSVTEILSAASA
jgi:hypothetical protein